MVTPMLLLCKTSTISSNSLENFDTLFFIISWYCMFYAIFLPLQSLRIEYNGKD